jgi:hypothetical protein
VPCAAERTVAPTRSSRWNRGWRAKLGFSERAVDKPIMAPISLRGSAEGGTFALGRGEAFSTVGRKDIIEALKAGADHHHRIGPVLVGEKRYLSRCAAFESTSLGELRGLLEEPLPKACRWFSVFIANGTTVMRIHTTVAIALLVPAAALANTQAETRIANGFMHLGMNHKKAVCYGGTISGKLDQQQATKAASIVESADNGKQVRQGVLKSGNEMIDAFTAAEHHCGR